MYYNINKRYIRDGQTVGYTVTGHGPDGLYDNTFIELRWFIPMVQKGIVKNVIFDGSKCVGQNGFRMSDLPKVDAHIYDSRRERIKKILNLITRQYYMEPFKLEGHSTEFFMSVWYSWYPNYETSGWFKFDIVYDKEKGKDCIVFKLGTESGGPTKCTQEIPFSLSDKEILFEVLTVIHRKCRFTFPLNTGNLMRLQDEM